MEYPKALCVSGPHLFLLIDVSFFLANLTKFSHGGWFSLAVAVVLVTILMILQWGNSRLKSSEDELQIPLDQLLCSVTHCW